MLDIIIPVPEKRTVLPLHDYNMDELWWIKKRWPDGWEWQYDFPDIWLDIKATINHWARLLWIRAARSVGYSIKRNDSYTEMVSVRVPVKDINEAIDKLPLAQMVMREPIMVVVGMEKYHQLMKLERDFLGIRVDKMVGSGPNVFIFSIPVILSRLCEGMMILPDMTGGCKYQLIETRKDHYRAIDYERDYRNMPRW